ncbi:hypothetical protein QBC33DRAFT_562996 [Phialemonium atrogriseum]|uniref:Nephrocystin 3-like N-terminal domain-containing protein n=1 Tax=Phialemonium atrogriseum TaxID=1093897 RepID=A0AAJ0BS05_9PEZI|nr:uncharacterized protein QBC33DRAFT_562996 [Phialemonium atrogriseum]KAK1763216.1 hypothetical protein QBC33DRAFT_562996 [Phialemonium atrogriseum]
MNPDASGLDPPEGSAAVAEAVGPARPQLSKRGVADTGVSIVYEPNSEPVIDIVFIHGLQGHPFKTWAFETNNGRKDSHDSSRQGGTSPSTGRKISAKLKNYISRLSSAKSVPQELVDQGSSHVFWPRDLLPMQCPQARILVVGYDTVIAKHQFARAANKNSIFTHSKDIVNDLSRSRPKGRPIIFVAHSLGGIIVKEVLAMCSTSSNEEFEDILMSTTRVVFLGTPHRGSSAARIGEIARKAASMLLMDTNARILDSLALRNSDLERCQDIFSSLWYKHNFSVKTFQEGLPLKTPILFGQSKMAKVVPDVSSCLGYSRERAETLDADHRSMCRYESALDPNYRKVSEELRAVYSGFLHKVDLDEVVMKASLPPAKPTLTCSDQEQLEYFRFPQMLLRQHTINSPAENTCQWLSETTAFRDWIERRNVHVHFGLLQITGKPGSGKSTLVKRIYQVTRSSLRAADGNFVAGFFFNARGDTLERCAAGLFRSLLYQIGNLHPSCLGSIKEYTVTELAGLEDDPAKYLNVLMSIVEEIFSTKAIAPRRSIIFIDALDECDPDEASETGYFFARLVKSAYKAGIKLDVCISRREYPSLTIRDCQELCMETYNAQDIRQYISQRLETVGIAPGDAKLLQDQISQRSNGIFLWVVLAVEGVLNDVENGKNAKYILKRTKALPKALKDLFGTLLKEMDPEDREISLRLFQWAVLATNRLRLREWHHILAFVREPPPVSLKEWRESEHHTETDGQLERQIRRLSQGLLEVKGVVDSIIPEENGDVGSILAGAGSLDSTTGDTRFLQPIHESVAEFLVEGHSNKFFLKAPDYDFTGEGHLSIVATCLDYIGISELDGYIAARGAGSPRRLRRRRSATSFMSSASAYSSRYGSRRNSQPAAAAERARVILTAAEVVAGWSPVRESEPEQFEQTAPSPALTWPRELDIGESAGGDTSEDSVRALADHPDLELESDRDASSWYDGDRNSNRSINLSIAGSKTSQTLEEYPALASYAINRLFVHAKDGFKHGADPKEVLRRLIVQDRWSRWFALQESTTRIPTCMSFLISRELNTWASLADQPGYFT